MKPDTREYLRVAGAMLSAIALILIGSVLVLLGVTYVLEWSALSAGLAACGVVWIVAGPAAVICGLWIIFSVGRHRLPLLIGGGGVFASGIVLVLGVMTKVIPCAGPS